MTNDMTSGADGARDVTSVERGGSPARQRALARGVELAARDLELAGGGLSHDEALAASGWGLLSFNASGMLGYLLRVELPDGTEVYPAFQFADVSLLPRMKRVRAGLPSDNAWLALNFLVRPDPRLDGRVPLDVLRGDDWELVLKSSRSVGEMGG
jgi:hypothetical protein